jgi:RimJ/RimL family protein N-acetyltransferase
MIRMVSIFQVALGPDIPAQAREWRNNDIVRRWCRQFSLLTEDDHTKWLKRISEDNTIKMFSILVEARAVGVCGLTSIDRVNQKAEFSLYIAPSELRNGYGKKALMLLMHHAFKQQNLNRIWGESFEGNPAIQMFEKLGLSCEGTQRQAYFRNGKFIDSHIYAITRSEFNERYRD